MHNLLRAVNLKFHGSGLMVSILTMLPLLYSAVHRKCIRQDSNLHSPVPKPLGFYRDRAYRLRPHCCYPDNNNVLAILNYGYNYEKLISSGSTRT